MDKELVLKVLGRMAKVAGYLLSSFLLGGLASPEVRDGIVEIVKEYPWVIVLLPSINMVLAGLAKIIKEKLPKSPVSKLI